MDYFDSFIINNARAIVPCLAKVVKPVAETCSVEYIHSGKVYMSVNGGPKTVISGPAVFWRQKGQSYDYGAEDDKGWDHQFVVISGKRAEELINKGFNKLSSNSFVKTNQSNLLKSLFAEIIELFNLTSKSSNRRAIMLIEKILCILADETESRFETDVHHGEIEQIANQIRNSPLNVYLFDKIAKELHLSYGQFRKLFSRYLGQSPYSFLLECRIKMACLLLADRKLQIKEIAYKCGYDDLSQFSKIFKKKIGMSPKNYRAIST